MRGGPSSRLLPHKTNFHFVPSRLRRPDPVGRAGASPRSSPASIRGLNCGIDFKGGTVMEMTDPAGQPIDVGHGARRDERARIWATSRSRASTATSAPSSASRSPEGARPDRGRRHVSRRAITRGRGPGRPSRAPASSAPRCRASCSPTGLLALGVAIAADVRLHLVPLRAAVRLRRGGRPVPRRDPDLRPDRRSPSWSSA